MQYNQQQSVEIYRNFLDWLFATFGEDEQTFRVRMIARLKLNPGDRVLITGCGFADEVPVILDAIGPHGEVYATDLSAELIAAAEKAAGPNGNVKFSVCDANQLPFDDRFFQAAYHFGGINLFNDCKGAISEMSRVVEVGGRVVFGDEGIGPWLKDTEYGRAAVANNALWAYQAPIDLLPPTALDVHLTWVLGNCFYVIDFEKSDAGPYINMDVKHRGRRGGSMRTRYFGQLEGVGEEAKKFVLEDAARRGLSVHDWLEQMIEERRKL